MNSKYTKIGCEIIVTRGDKVLLGLRKNCGGAGTWGLPGGHLEYGEKMIEAAVRELKEELGIVVDTLPLVRLSDSYLGDPHYLHATFLLEEYTGEYTLCEPDKCERWEWFPCDPLPAGLSPFHVEILDGYNRGVLYD